MKEKNAASRLLIKRIIWVFIGVIFIGMGSAFLRIAGMGNDPFGCMNIGVSGLIGMSFGSYQLIVNIVLLIPMFIFMRKGIGIGTFVNMIGVGYVSDFVIFIFGKMGLSVERIASELTFRSVFLIAGVLIMCLGIAIYMECNLGIAPYDALGEMIPMWTKDRIKFFAARIITDVICVLIGYMAGSVVWIATIITAFFTGPVVSFFRRLAAPRLK